MRSSGWESARETRKDTVSEGKDEDPGARERIVLGSRSHRHLSQSVLLDEAVAPRHVRLTIAMICGGPPRR